jgi:two-component system, OmpR family, response regulator
MFSGLTGRMSGTTTPGPELSMGGMPPAGTGRLLVVEDESYIADALSTSLSFRGFTVQTANTGRDALGIIAREPPDLVLLDVMLPDTDGFTLMRQLRADGVDIPVIFLTARDTGEDRIAGLTIGGDDYITKPFGLDEVAARVRAVLRRTYRPGSQPPFDRTDVLRVADLHMDQASYRVQRAGVDIALSPTEYRLLRYLMLNAGKVVTRRQILDQVWHYDFAGNDAVVATYVSYLRQKLDALGPPLIHTQRGFGYCLRAQRQ